MEDNSYFTIEGFFRVELIPQIRKDGYESLAKVLDTALNKKLPFHRTIFSSREIEYEEELSKAVASLDAGMKDTLRAYVKSRLKEIYEKSFMELDTRTEYRTLLLWYNEHFSQ